MEIITSGCALWYMTAACFSSSFSYTVNSFSTAFTCETASGSYSYRFSFISSSSWNSPYIVPSSSATKSMHQQSFMAKSVSMPSASFSHCPSALPPARR